MWRRIINLVPTGTVVCASGQCGPESHARRLCRHNSRSHV